MSVEEHNRLAAADRISSSDDDNLFANLMTPKKAETGQTKKAAPKRRPIPIATDDTPVRGHLKRKRAIK